MVKKVGPVPPEIFNRRQAETAGLEWFTNMIEIIELQASAITDLNQTITNPPTQAEVQAISDKVDEILAALRTVQKIST